jgi:hypothetical protein
VLESLERRAIQMYTITVAAEDVGDGVVILNMCEVGSSIVDGISKTP